MLLKKSFKQKFLFVFFAFSGLVMSFYLYRFIYLKNFRIVIPYQIYRSAQPAAPDIAYWHDYYQIKSILNLRGHEKKGDVKRAINYAKEIGLNVNAIRLSSRKLPSKEELKKIVEIINNSPRPLLIHCMRGVDRTGLVSAISVLLNNQSMDKAWEQFDWKKGFLPYRKQELLKTVILDYEKWLASNHLVTSKDNFVFWSNQLYNPI